MDGWTTRQVRLAVTLASSFIQMHLSPRLHPPSSSTPWHVSAFLLLLSTKGTREEGRKTGEGRIRIPIAHCAHRQGDTEPHFAVSL